MRKFTYLGKTRKEIAECNDSINVNDDPSQVIIHGGTNNLTTDQAEVRVGELKNVVAKFQTKFPNSSIGVSSLVYTEDINVELCRMGLFSETGQSHSITICLRHRSTLGLNWSRGASTIGVESLKVFQSTEQAKEDGLKASE
ncbi:Hypothetical predicted protein, partial [Paramuricea clavata]